MTSRIRVALVTLACFAITSAAPAVTLKEVRNAIAASGARWIAGETGVSRLSPERMRGLCGAILSRSSDPEAVTPEYPGKDTGALDWRDHGGNWTTPVRDQGQCGACATFATVAVAESMFKITRGDPLLEPDFSEQHVFACSLGVCSWGQMPFQSLLYLQNNGAPDEACFPYHSGDAGQTLACSQTCSDWRNRAFKTSGYYHVMGTVDAIKAALATGPVYAGFEVYEDFFYYRSGVYSHQTGDLQGGHAIELIGYDDAQQAWIAKNSWNTNWGEKGFFYIAYGECGINNDVYAVQVDGANVCSGSVAPMIGGPYYDASGATDAPSVAPGASLDFWLDYSDFNCDLPGGEMWVAFDNGAPERLPDALPATLDCDNTRGGGLLKASVSGAFAEGAHTFDAYLTDLCGGASNTVSGQFEVQPPAGDDDTGGGTSSSGGHHSGGGCG